MTDFIALLRASLVSENNYTETDAETLIKKYPDIIMQDIHEGITCLACYCRGA